MEADLSCLSTHVVHVGISYIFSHDGLECIPSSVQFAIKCFCFFLVFVVVFFTCNNVDCAYSFYVQSNLSSLNMANMNSFLSPYEILPIVQENKYVGKFSYSFMKLYVVCTHKNCLIKAFLITRNIPLLCRRSKRFP